MYSDGPALFGLARSTVPTLYWWFCGNVVSIVQYFARSMEQLYMYSVYVMFYSKHNHNGQTQKNLLLHAET